MFLVWDLLSAEPSSDWTGGLAIGMAIVVVVVSAGTLFAFYRTGRSMSRRIGEASAAARRVANKDLVDVLDALRDPESDLGSIAPLNLDTEASDEVGDMARSLDELHRSLIDVGARQMETLREGVSSIFVTLARRNSSLVDRQLALLDELESREESPEVLGGFYQIDHLATRMRRNAESLLVLAGSESPRVWAKPTDMSDVVRAAVGEIDDYQRIEVLALEPARLSGGAVSDVSHLVAELLENAIQFSPPSEMIRVTGLFDTGGYQLAVTDRGVGMTDARIAELNRILERPPALGLSVERTLGMYVVAKLAHRHGLKVELIRGVPGVTARITIPRDHLEIAKDESRPFDAEHTERIAAERRRAAAVSAAEYRDAETREYVLNRTQLRKSGPEESERVIDLTQPVHDTKPPSVSPGGLPVRTPGGSYSDEDDAMHAVSAAAGGSRIKSALEAYDQGRRSADDDEGGEHQTDSDPEELS